MWQTDLETRGNQARPRGVWWYLVGAARTRALCGKHSWQASRRCVCRGVRNTDPEACGGVYLVWQNLEVSRTVSSSW